MEELARKLVQLVLASEGHSVRLLLTQGFVNELHCTQLRDSGETDASVVSGRETSTRRAPGKGSCPSGRRNS